MEPAASSPQFNPVATLAEQQRIGVMARRADDEARQIRETREVVPQVSDRVSLSEDARGNSVREASRSDAGNNAQETPARGEQTRAEAVRRQADEQPEQTPRSITRALEAYSQSNALTSPRS